MVKACAVLMGLLFAGALHAQDSTYYIEYPHKIYIGYYEAVRSYVLRLTPRPRVGSYQHVYTTGSQTASGLQFGYDKISVSINFRTVPNNLARHGNNHVFDISFEDGSNKVLVEALYQHCRGFYDRNSSSYNLAYAAPNPFYRVPAMTNNLLSLRFSYFTNHHRYANKAALGSNFRQVRSALSPMVSAGVYYMHMHASDGLVSSELRPFYGTDAGLYKFTATGLSIGAGLAGTYLVLQKFFINGMGLFTADPQWRRYLYLDKPLSSTVNLALGIESRFTLGYNGERLYAALWTQESLNNFNNASLKIASGVLSGGLTVAFRIDLHREPEWLQQLKDSRLYQLL